VAPKRGHWLSIRAVDPAHGREAYGAVITVEAGKRRWVGTITPGQSYLCSGEPRAHFGLGEAAQVDVIRVRWPDGARTEEVFEGGPADRRVVLYRGRAKPAAD
jgi:hypothetical protein